MSNLNPTHNDQNPNSVNPLLILVGIGFAALAGLALAAALAGTGLSPSLKQLASNLLALQSVQVTWYVTRAAGWVAYLLLWLSTIWGLAVPSKIFNNFLSGVFTYDFHQFLSLLALAFTGIHITVLAFDHFSPFSVTQILLPFLAPYRPVWVGVGGIAFYLSLLVTITFYIRSRIGMRAFRVIHYTSLIAFFGAAVHGLMAGTDSPLPVAGLIYLVTILSVVFFTSYWLIAGLQQKRQQRVKVKQSEVVVRKKRAR